MPISIINGKLRTPPHVQVQSSTYIYNETLANKQNFYKGSHGKRLPGKPQVKSTKPAAVTLRPKGCPTSNKGLSHFGQRAVVAERVAESSMQNYVICWKRLVLVTCGRVIHNRAQFISKSGQYPHTSACLRSLDWKKRGRKGGGRASHPLENVRTSFQFAISLCQWMPCRHGAQRGCHTHNVHVWRRKQR